MLVTTNTSYFQPTAATLLTFLLLAALLNDDEAVISAAHLGRVRGSCTPTGGSTKESNMLNRLFDWFVVSLIVFVLLVVPQLLQGVVA